MEEAKLESESILGENLKKRIRNMADDQFQGLILSYLDEMMKARYDQSMPTVVMIGKLPKTVNQNLMIQLISNAKDDIVGDILLTALMHVKGEEITTLFAKPEGSA